VDKGLNFFSPLLKVAPFVLPVYSILAFCAWGVYSLFNKSEEAGRIFVFLIGFTAMLHLVFGSRSLRTRKGDFLKANYLFSGSFIYIITLIILALGLSLFFPSFSFVSFCTSSFREAQHIFTSFINQLFAA
jgi:hypothetical protein